MPNYDFHNCLSPREFEELVRDILEIKEKVPFEISGRGKDGGIDLRYWEGMTKIIVQIKCYQNNYKQLFNVLKNQEKQKAKALEPTRYILVTSIALQIRERDEIFDLFDGLILTRDDIIDRDDLNKLLGNEQYQQVERTHYKLWLSSTNIFTSLIEEIVHRDIYAESRAELEEIRKTVKVFVQNPSFGRAIDILENFRYVLISGEPGIGKTTLGRCLAAYYLQRKGYNEFVFADTVGTALRMYKETEKQVFFFDDFWGDIFKDEKIPHNEEKHLLKFIQRISSSPNKILILTSREYVVQQGLTEYQDEKLRRMFEIGKCVVQLEDYSDLTKARILFNHLYFSCLKWEYVKVIADKYEEIISHSNYNPRIIETFLEQGSFFLADSSPWEYYKEFLKYLGEPFDFWKSIFMKQTYGSQLTAIILFLSTQPMRLVDLKASYYSCLEVGGQSNLPIHELEFESIIAQLEKTMIKTYREDSESTILVKFQNPSIKDFLYSHLTENINFYGKILIKGCTFINQLLFLFKATNLERGINDDSGGGSSPNRIRLPEGLENLLVDKIITEFNTLKYSYPDNKNVYESKPSIYINPEDCIVRKIQDILFSFEINENEKMDEFIKAKIQFLCSKIHEENYPLSYDDMVEFPYVIKASLPLKINIDGKMLINDFYKRSRFAEHLLTLNVFEEVFPKEFNEFKKMNNKTIKKNIKYVLLDDVDFYASDMEYERIDYLIDILYPRILEEYKLRDSKTFVKDLYYTAGSYYNNRNNEGHQLWLNIMEENKTRIKNKEEERKRVGELIKEEKEAILGATVEMTDEEIIAFIQKNVQSEKEASELITLFRNEKPWYIWPFFSDWHRLSLLISFYHEEKKLPLTSAAFYEQFSSYLIDQYNNTTSIRDAMSIVESFSEFAYDMMIKGEITFTEQTIAKHPAFREKMESGQHELYTLLSFPFIVQRGKWYQFQTIGFHAYLSVKRFLCLNEEKKPASYKDFLGLNRYFIDIEHDIWIICSELDIKDFYRYYLVPILKEYLVAVDTTNSQTVCSSTFHFLELILCFKVSPDTYLPDVSGSTCNGLYSSALEFIGHDLLDMELALSCYENENNNEVNSDLLRLGRFIMEQDSPGFEENEYELDLAQIGTNPELLDIFESLGVCDLLRNLYQKVLDKIEKTEADNYSIRLDSYSQESKIRRFAFID